ncbi:MAG: hypothetical protein K0M45_05230 [Candidatus Paracaedibacteraceae bacterium]|nr:hypothetical protein [Candidatus Paracaedibacteraceae bacterium]
MLSVSMVNCAQAIILEEIIEGTHLARINRGDMAPSTEEPDSIPGLNVRKEPRMVVDEEGKPDPMEQDGCPNTADEGEGTDILGQDDGWPSRAFERAKIDEAIAGFFSHKRIAYYLGSFDPVHKGHEAVANHVINMDVITQIINESVTRDKIDYTLICPIWGGDSMKQRTSIELRLNMLFKVFEKHPHVIVTRMPPYKLQELFTQRVSSDSNNIVVKIPGLQFFGLLGSDIPDTFHAKMKPDVPNFMAGTVISPDRMFTTFGAVDALPVESYLIALRGDAPQHIKEMKEFVDKPATVFEPGCNVKRMSSTEFKKLYKKKMSTTVSTAEEEGASRAGQEEPLTAETMIHPGVFEIILENNLYMDRKISSESVSGQTREDGVANAEEGKVEIMDYTGTLLNIPTIKVESAMEEESGEDPVQERDLDDNTIFIYQASTSVPTYHLPVNDSLISKELVRNLHLSPRGKDPKGDTERLSFNPAVISSIENNNLSPRFLEGTSENKSTLNRVVKGVKKGSAAIRRVLSRSSSAGNSVNNDIQPTSDANKENVRPLGKSQSLGSSVGTASKRLRTLSNSQPEQERKTFIPTGDNYKPLIKSQSLRSPLGNPHTAILVEPALTLPLNSSLGTSRSLELNLDALNVPKEKQKRSLSMSDPSSYSHKSKLTTQGGVVDDNGTVLEDSLA